MNKFIIVLIGAVKEASIFEMNAFLCSKVKIKWLDMEKTLRNEIHIIIKPQNWLFRWYLHEISVLGSDKNGVRQRQLIFLLHGPSG